MAVMSDAVKGAEHGLGAAEEQRFEIRFTVIVQAYNFSVQNGILDWQPRDSAMILERAATKFHLCWFCSRVLFRAGKRSEIQDTSVINEALAFMD
jgi:hypothetical protein